MHFRAAVDLYKRKPDSGGSSCSLCTAAFYENTVLEPSGYGRRVQLQATTWYTEKSWEIQLRAPKSFVLSLPQILWYKMEKVEV